MSKNHGEYMTVEHEYRQTGYTAGSASGDILLRRSPIGACQNTNTRTHDSMRHKLS